MNIFMEMIAAIYDIKSYPKFMKDRKSKTFFFGVMLVILYFLLVTITPMVRFQITKGGLIQVLDDALPEFYLRDGKAHIEEKFHYDKDMYIFVDTDLSLSDLDDEVHDSVNTHEKVLIMAKDGLVLQNDDELISSSYEELFPGQDFTKAEALSYLQPWVTGAIVVMTVISFIGQQLAFFFNMIFVALLGMAVAASLRVNMTFGELYKMGIYTRVTPLLFKAVCSFLPFDDIPGILMWMICLSISVVYFIAVMKQQQEYPIAEG